MGLIPQDKAGNHCSSRAQAAGSEISPKKQSEAKLKARQSTALWASQDKPEGMV